MKYLYYLFHNEIVQVYYSVSLYYLEGIVLNLRGKFRNSKLNFWEDVPTLKIHQDIKGFF
jgi:hypothetical protein